MTTRNAYTSEQGSLQNDVEGIDFMEENFLADGDSSETNNLHGKVGLETPKKVDCAYVLRPASFGTTTIKDIKKLAGLTGDNIFSYNAHALHSWAWIPVFLLGTTW